MPNSDIKELSVQTVPLNTGNVISVLRCYVVL